MGSQSRLAGLASYLLLTTSWDWDFIAVVGGMEKRALECLGKGFDLTSDFRIKFAKGDGSTRLVKIDEVNKRDIVVPGGGATIADVSDDIRCDKGDRLRFKSDVLQFNQVS